MLRATCRQLALWTIFFPTYYADRFARRICRRLHWHPVDEHLLLGALPRARHLKQLAELGVTGVVNLCEEFRGDRRGLQATGLEQLWLPTLDFTPPKLEDICRGIEFIERHRDQGGKIYVHCKAGRGRSATIALCWLMHTQGMSPEEAQAFLCSLRPVVVRSLCRRAVVQSFATRGAAASLMAG